MNPIDYLTNSFMIPLLNAVYGISHSYGLAIIFLTVIIKLILFPLTAKQFKASRQMQLLQPKLAELQAKHKDKPEELQIKMMEFYKENNANPFSSCLPTLIQLPFLFALYSALANTEFQAKIANHGFLFIQNLATVGVMHPKQGIIWDNLLMILFFGASSFVMQKMMTTNPDDPMQKQMLYMMPIMMTVMFLFFPWPSGLLLYLVTSNVITVAQNYVLMRGMPLVASASPASKAVIDTPSVTVSDEDKKPKKPNKPDASGNGKKGS